MVNKRDKDGDRESSDSKKHRKTNSSSSLSTSSTNASESQAIKAKIDVYAVCMDMFHILMFVFRQNVAINFCIFPSECHQI